MFSFVEGANKSVDMDDREANVVSSALVDGSNSSSGAAPVVDRAITDGTPRVVDVEIARPTPGRLLAGLVLLGIGLLGLVAIILAIRPSITSKAETMVFSIGVAVVIGVGIWLLIKRKERAVEKGLREAEAEDGGQLAKVIIGNPTWSGQPRLDPLYDELVRRGWWGTTLRLWWRKPLEKVHPFEITFEPRLLDEAEPSLRELMVILDDESGAAERDEGRRTSTESAFGRRLRRNVIMSGGWLALLAFVPMFLQSLSESVNSGTVTLKTIFFGTLILALLIMPRANGGAWLHPKELLIVPGGLLLRQAKRRGLVSELHLFRRETSILCACPQRGRLWAIIVSDADRRDTFHITEDEVNVALRAWLSPIEPPPVERLSDFS